MKIDVVLKLLFKRSELFLLKNQKLFMLRKGNDPYSSSDSQSDNLKMINVREDEMLSKYFKILLKGTKKENRSVSY